MSISKLICIISIFCLPALSWGLSLHCGPNREPYDPAREGCCKKPDGTGARHKSRLLSRAIIPEAVE